MDNIDEYVLSFRNYKEGKYEYGTIASLNDIENAVRNGKKFVFTQASAKIEIIIGLILISSGLIITLIYYAILGYLGIEALTVDLIIFIITLLPIFVFAPLGLRFLISGLLKLRSNFIVLGAEGIVYKKRRDIKGYNWEDISIDVVEQMSKTKKFDFKEIYISMPNGDLLKSIDYTTKEFPIILWRIVILTFLNYYNYSKLGTFEPPDFWIGEENNMDNHNILEELKEAYKSYKKGEYTFGKYWTGDQIEKAFLDGKTFVLKGTKKIFLLPILMLIIAAIMFFYFKIYETYLSITFSIIFAIFEFFFIIVCIIVIRRFVVISPSGVYYRRAIRKGFFEWKNVTLPKASFHTTELVRTTEAGPYKIPVTTARVIIILPNKKKVRFDLERFGCKEFVRKVRRVMFIRLFQIYHKLAEDKIKEKIGAKMEAATNVRYMLRIEKEIGESGTERINSICGYCGVKSNLKTIDEEHGIFQCLNCGAENYLLK